MRPVPLHPALLSLAGCLAALLGGCSEAPDRSPTGLDAPPSAARGSPTGDLAQTQGFRNHLTVAGIREHQAAFQVLADLNGGNRASAGYEASAQYVGDRLRDAGYSVTEHFFQFNFVGEGTPSVLQQTAPNATSYVNGVDFVTMSYSGSGDVTAPVVAVDLVIPASGPGSSTSGCEPSDFAGFPAGSIALVQRGTCTFRVKATNAMNAGAIGVIVFNDGSPGRTGIFSGTLGQPALSIPVVGTTFAVGIALREPGATARLATDMINEMRVTRNVIAETPDGDPNRVVVVGAQLDSDLRGPGINTASGAAALLEIAEVFATREQAPRNKVRFVWFGAHEFDLVGATQYVAGLGAAERSRIAAMLSVDRIGSPNFVRFVYDGDNSDFAAGAGVRTGPTGSGTIEGLFLDYFAGVGLEVAPFPLSGPSSYEPFLTHGIPIGGLFAGAEDLKTPAQAAIYGGVAGTAYDPCYRLACDTFANNSDTALDQLSDAAAHVVVLLSRRNFAKDPL